MAMNKFSFIFYSTDRAEVCFPRNNFCCTWIIDKMATGWRVVTGWSRERYLYEVPLLQSAKITGIFCLISIHRILRAPWNKLIIPCTIALVIPMKKNIIPCCMLKKETYSNQCMLQTLHTCHVTPLMHSHDQCKTKFNCMCNFHYQ